MIFHPGCVNTSNWLELNIAVINISTVAALYAGAVAIVSNKKGLHFLCLKTSRRCKVSEIVISFDVQES